MIYFIQDRRTFAIKIGYTSADNPESRQKALQTGNPNELVILGGMPGSQQDEQALHRRFAHCRLAGEWFNPAPDLLQLVIQAGNLPATKEPAKKPWPLKIYLAGKITWDNNWRADLVDIGFPESAHWPILPQALCGVHDYCGPYFISEPSWNPCGRGLHGMSHLQTFEVCQSCSRLNLVGTLSQCSCGVGFVARPRQELVAAACDEAIRNCDLLFAWLDEPDCYGTLVEIGYAAALGKMIWIATAHSHVDMWFGPKHY